MTFEFQPWPKMSRLNRQIVITEKIDGTNAAIHIPEDGKLGIAAQSRKRLITPGDDNFGFARWVWDYAEELTEILGPGLHFGEWWGSGIQRGYGLTRDDKRFSLFNTTRWLGADLGDVEGLGVVPVLYEGDFDTYFADEMLIHLKTSGSLAAPGFMRPEGIVVFHTAANLCFKATIENDELPKALAPATAFLREMEQ